MFIQYRITVKLDPIPGELKVHGQRMPVHHRIHISTLLVSCR